jgi:ubiquinone/menaquinone biosynthesis C-methylase UbiE
MKNFKTIASRFHQLNCGNIGNVVYWREFFRMAAGVAGDVVECGVGRGRSLLILAALNDLLDVN